MKKIITIVFCLVFVSAFAAEKHIQLEWNSIQSVETYNGHKINFLSFENSILADDFASLPVFVAEYNSPSGLLSYEFDIKNEICDTLSAQLISRIADNDILNSEFQWVYKNNELKLLPIKLLKDGRAVCLLSFDIIDYQVPVQKEVKHKKLTEPEYADNSVLSVGKWFKMGIVNTGVHKLSYNDILTMGLDPSSINLQKIGVFGNYYGMLPEANEDTAPDDLKEMPIETFGFDDGTWNQDDYLIFYAQAEQTWRYNPFTGRFDFFKNLYADTVFCFFTPNMGSAKSMAQINSLNITPVNTVSSFVDYYAHEVDSFNMINSGKKWYGELLSTERPQINFKLEVPHLRKDKAVFMVFELIARSFETSSYEVFVNDKLVVDSTKISKVDAGGESIFARESMRSVTFFVDDNILNIKPIYNPPLITSRAWISYFKLNYERDLVFDGGQMNFRQPAATGLGNTTKFEILNNTDNAEVWEITDIYSPRKINTVETENNINFIIGTDSLMEFVVFDHDNYYSPVSFRQIPNQNLHNCNVVDFVIISPELFLDQANRLAGIHSEHDGLKTLVVTPEQIYNEFSSGSQDVSAIRNFMRMIYTKNRFQDGYGYLLLFGDGSFDYKHRISDNNNMVPTYESMESLKFTQSYGTDDYFGLLDPNEGAYCQGILDIGIGRFPVSTHEQAVNAVDKVENYLIKDKNRLNNWAKKICLIADDGDNNLHFKQANNQLAPIADTLNEGIIIDKLFSDAYPRTDIPGGHRFPDMNVKINEQIKEGALIVNYTGHGGLIGWSDELILDVPMIHAFENFNNLPLFITATCEFSRYDNPEFTSAGEYVFLNENGGGIALLTTTRLAYAHANIILNQRVYRNLMKREDGQLPRMGDLIRMSKNPSSINFLNFTLLGDPALRLAYPDEDIKTISVNNKSVSVTPDTIQGLSEVTIEGVITLSNNEIDENFNGYIYPEVYDKTSTYYTLGTASGSYPTAFTLDDKILYQAKATVTNGKFSFNFIVPRDIGLYYDFGKISYYAMDTIRNIDAWGGYKNFIIGGLNPDAENDGIGPEISLFINSYDFINGDNVDNPCMLIAQIKDDNGLNVSGNGLGRDLLMLLDESTTNSVVLNSYYEPDADTYKSGSINYNLGNLEPGLHTISLRAWDMMNNSSVKSIEFIVNDIDNKPLSGVYNYPNPFAEQTTFAFKSGSKYPVMKVEVRIFDAMGNHITNLFADFGEYGNTLSEIKWDGTDSNGNNLKQGIYLYNIYVTDTQGITSVVRQKIMKIN